MLRKLPNSLKHIGTLAVILSLSAGAFAGEGEGKGGRGGKRGEGDRHGG